MSKKDLLIIIVFFLILGAVAGIKIKSVSIRQEREIEAIADAIAVYPEIGKIIEDITYIPSVEGIQFVVEFKEYFSKAPVLEQFGFLNAYMIKLREYLNASEWNSCWRQENIILISNNLNTEYKYVSACWNKEVKADSYNETFYVDGEIAYTSSQYSVNKKEYIVHLQEEYINGYSDWEIMKYTVSVFNLITYGGQVLTLENDGKQIIKEITERYGITEKQFGEIYRKYFIVFYE